MAHNSAQGQQIIALGSNHILALLDEFLLERQADRECRPRTLAWYRATILMFVRFLEERGYPTDYDAVETRHIRAFRLYLQEPVRWDGKGSRGRPLSDSMRATYDRALRIFFGWLVTVGYLDKSPVAELPRPRVRRKPQRFLTADELERLWRSFPANTRQGHRDRLLFLLLVDTGMRASEICGLRIDNVDLQAGKVRLEGKGGHIREVGLSPQTLQQMMLYVRKWRQKTALPDILLHAVKRKPVAYGALLRIFERWREQAGIETSFSAHSFRRTAATRAVQAGADPLSLAAQMGWADLQMAKVYVQNAGLDIAALQSRHSPLKGLKLR